MGQTLGILEALREFIDRDTAARWKTITITIAVGGACGAVDLAVLNRTTATAIQDMTIGTVITLIVSIGWFCLFAHRTGRLREHPLVERRDLLRAATAGLASIVIGSLSRAHSHVLDRQVSAAIGDPNPRKIKAANYAIATANSAGLHLQSAVKYGKEILSEGGIELDKDRWEATLLALQQRTFDTEAFVPPLPETLKEDIVAPFSFPYPVPGRTRWHGKWVDSNSNDRARFYRLSRGEPKYGSKVPQYLLISDAIATMDDCGAQNAVFEDSRIVYKGGPTDLARVYFVRCVFDLDFNENCKAFAKSVLNEVPVTFVATRA